MITTEILRLGFIYLTGIFFLLNFIADAYIGEKTFIIAFIFTAWAALIIFFGYRYNVYILTTGIMYFVSFWQHIRNQKHVPIIISGIITVWASYILTHN